MHTIQLETKIAAPANRCFLLSLNVDLHIESTAQTQERAIAGVTHGLMVLDNFVTWQGRHFGVMLRQTSKITAYHRPTFFQDTMIGGLFKSFVHDHRFEENDGRTHMLDELRFTAPLGILGTIAETLVLKRYLTAFLMKRNALIKQIAETEAWRTFIPEEMLRQESQDSH